MGSATIQRTVAVAAQLTVLLACTGPPVVESGVTSTGLYFEASGQGEPVVLLHGFSLDRRMWDAEVDRLEGAYRVVRYDLRGHGLSAEPLEPYAAYDDLLSLLDELAIERATLVGLSAGAQLAVDFALAYPERVERLVLAAPGLGGYQPQGSFEWMAPVMEALQAGDSEEATRRWAETPLMTLSDAEAAARVREIVLGNSDLWTYDPSLQKALEPPAVGRLAEISAPTLLLVGENDSADTRRVVDLLEAGIEGAQRIDFAGAPHLLNLAAPQRFGEAVVDFLAASGDS